MKVAGLPPVADISAGALPDGPTHVLAATTTGAVYTWGDSSPHPADPPTPTTPTAAPEPARPITGREQAPSVTAVATPAAPAAVTRVARPTAKHSRVTDDILARAMFDLGLYGP